jgi:molybdopterin synthase catalytic subunit
MPALRVHLPAPRRGLAILFCAVYLSDVSRAIDYWEPETENREVVSSFLQVFMEIRVLFFGMLKDLAGRPSDLLSLPESATLGDVLDHYERVIPRLKEFTSSIALSVNQQYAAPDMKLSPGDEVALLPPVSGGSAESSSDVAENARSRHAAIVSGVIDTAALVKGIRHPEDGAVAVFEGIVRNHSRGRRTLYLDYEAYEGMALKEMEELAARALSEFRIRDVALVHRLGRLEIGETSVLIVVASAHRAAAFDACRWLIDTLKRTVPIWKKEYFEDGAVWADGEPFPDEIPGREGTHSSERASK